MIETLSYRRDGQKGKTMQDMYVAFIIDSRTKEIVFTSRLHKTWGSASKALDLALEDAPKYLDGYVMRTQLIND